MMHVHVCVYLHGGQIDGVLGTVLEGSQSGNLLQMLFTGLTMRYHTQQGLQVIWQHLAEHTGLFLDVYHLYIIIKEIYNLQS